MSPRIREHIVSFMLIWAIGVAAIALLQLRRNGPDRDEGPSSALLAQPFVRIDDPLHRAVLGDIQELYFGDDARAREAFSAALRQRSEENVYKRLDEAHTSETLSAAKIGQIVVMFLKFLLTYASVMAITYYGVETVAVYRYVARQRRHASASTRGPSRWLTSTLSSVGMVAAGLVLFSPAYVIAYSIRTEFSTDDFVFMVLLATVSNGLLVTYANKFFVFLTAESRKGYVMTAVVKNLGSDYSAHHGGIPLRAILHPRKRFTGHVFNHIFANARVQYIPTIKEQAAFLVTGLVIIEMALNIHGHLSYEMLRQLLFRNDDIVIAILLAIFAVVKLTELTADLVVLRLARRYGNA